MTTNAIVPVNSRKRRGRTLRAGRPVAVAIRNCTSGSTGTSATAIPPTVTTAWVEVCRTSKYDSLRIVFDEERRMVRVVEWLDSGGEEEES